jgi:hypothetical protein
VPGRVRLCATSVAVKLFLRGPLAGRHRASGAAAQPGERSQPAFPFQVVTDNLLMASDAFIHAGFNVMKTLRVSTPNG